MDISNSRAQMHPSIASVTDLEGIPASELRELARVTKVFEFRVSPYYARLVDWSNPNDPLRSIVLPDIGEENSDLTLDASLESDVTVAHGVQHKYRSTALLLVTDVCASYCRFCFRKRFTLSTTRSTHIAAPGAARGESETTLNIEPGLRYIASRPEITCVLLTGGDPFMLSPKRIGGILRQLEEIRHVKVVRIGTKVPAFDPARVSRDLVDVLGEYVAAGHCLQVMTQFNHTRELTEEARRAVNALTSIGAGLYNQTPLLRGVNDQTNEIAGLFSTLATWGVRPYYLFHCRPTQGNERFLLTLRAGSELVTAARAHLDGVAKSFRYVASHASGKIEIVGRLDDRLIFRYHQAREPRDHDRMMTWPISDEVYWLDEVVSAHLRETAPATLSGQSLT